MNIIQFHPSMTARIIIGYSKWFIMGNVLLYFGADIISISFANGTSEYLYHLYLIGAGMIIYPLTFPAELVSKNSFGFVLVTLLIALLLVTIIPIREILSFAAQNSPQITNGHSLIQRDFI